MPDSPTLSNGTSGIARWAIGSPNVSAPDDVPSTNARRVAASARAGFRQFHWRW